jgi:vacuolar-type H+-ATPase subunit H
MEELQSTEALDREILEDARKKAYRILKSAEETVKAAAESWEKKADEAIEELRRKYGERARSVRAEIVAGLVLDKRRARSEKIEGLLRAAIDACFEDLPHETMLFLLETELGNRIEELRRNGEGPFAEGASGQELAIQIANLSEADAAALLDKTGLRWKLQGALKNVHDKKFPLVVADMPSVRIIVSIDTVARNLLEDRRAELLDALLGSEAFFLEGLSAASGPGERVRMEKEAS